MRFALWRNMQTRPWYWLSLLCSCAAPELPAEHAVTPRSVAQPLVLPSQPAPSAKATPATGAEASSPPPVPSPEPSTAEELLERGLRYVRGDGVPTDLKEAASWISKAAAEGHPRAEYLMGLMATHGDGVAKDEAAAAFWFTKAAKHGHVEAYHPLGLAYDSGSGVAEDDAEAARWYQAAADKQVPESMNNLGWFYFHGTGVPKDEKEAVRLFQASADLGNSFAHGGLALAYDYGAGGVAPNSDRALELYEKSGTEWSKDHRARLAKRAKCERGATTPLFDVKLLCGERGILRYKIAASGARVIRESRSEWGDTYDTSGVLSGSTQLYVGYTRDDWFAVAEYQFPGEALEDVAIRNITKYGRPRTSSGNTQLGPFRLGWRTKDGIEIELQRDWPPVTVYVAYKHPTRFRQMKAEQSEQENRQKDERYRNETRAF
jgi:Sel1 repeat